MLEHVRDLGARALLPPLDVLAALRSVLVEKQVVPGLLIELGEHLALPSAASGLGLVAVIIRPFASMRKLWKTYSIEYPGIRAMVSDPADDVGSALEQGGNPELVVAVDRDARDARDGRPT